MKIYEKFWRHNMNKIISQDYIGKTYGCLTIKNIKMKNNGRRIRRIAECKCICGNSVERNFPAITNNTPESCGECDNGVPYKDYIGKSYGCLTIKNIKLKNWKRIAECKCICGNRLERDFYMLKKNTPTTCGNCWNGVPYKDYIGKSYGCLTIENIKLENGKRIAECKCICGNRVERNFYRLITRNATSCGNCWNGIPYKDYIGKTYGCLTIKNIKFENGNSIAECKCICGNSVERNFTTLTNRTPGSCGECDNGVPYKDYIGKSYGCLTIENIKMKNWKRIAECKCICGNKVERNFYDLKKNTPTTCGICYKGIALNNYIGRTYGYFTIKSIIKKGKGLIYVKCQCKCHKFINVKLTNLVSGISKSCGCFRSVAQSIQKISFGRLHVIGTSNNTLGGLRYFCKCDCGNEIEVLESDLFTGKVTCCDECKENL